MSTTREPRLMIYSQDGLGLGHMRRTGVLAGHFLQASPGASVLTVSDSPTGRFFASPSGHDFLKLPSVYKLRPGEWQPVSLAARFTDVLEFRREVIRAAAVAFAPDVLLVDHMPHGAMGELVPALEALTMGGTRLVLGLRDILDAPAVIRQRWQLEGALAAVENHYDEVLVYGSREVFDVAGQYSWPAEVSTLVRYCGYVCAPPSADSPAALRRRLLRGTPDGKLIVAMAGGGADAHDMFEALLLAMPRLRSTHQCLLTLITGPFVSDTSWVRLKQLSRGLRVRVIRTVSDAPSYIAAADLVVAMAGYNTTAEILRSGRPALLVPRAGPSAEQQMRASRFAERGWVHWLPPATLSGSSMADAVEGALASRPEAVNGRPDLGGARRVAQHLLSGFAAARAAATPDSAGASEVAR
jgi:predicted glycosyltransferase